MLAVHFPNNWDIHVYFEDDETERVQREKLRGLFFNSIINYPHAPLEISTKNGICPGIETIIDQTDETIIKSVKIEVSAMISEKFRKKRFFETHEGHRHIILLDVNGLDSNYHANYIKLKHLEAKAKGLPQPTIDYFYKYLLKT